jgi:hypothetical protein
VQAKHTAAHRVGADLGGSRHAVRGFLDGMRAMIPEKCGEVKVKRRRSERSQKEKRGLQFMRLNNGMGRA